MQTNNTNIVFCCIDNSDSYESDQTRRLIRNQAEYTISNIFQKGYTVVRGTDEDLLLKSLDQYHYAVVFNIGTEFINGFDFFNAIEQLITQDFYLAGHILDRSDHDAYYELHHQCYVINLDTHRAYANTPIGQQAFDHPHQQIVPNRSSSNFHDNYTPKWVKQGWTITTYQHKCHGWRILGEALMNNLSIIVFDDKIRNSKRYYYPENQADFDKQVEWAYYRQKYCAEEFVHTANTETSSFTPPELLRQVVTPASGTWYDAYIDPINPVTVIFYDYNQKSLDYWSKHAPIRKNVTYKYIRCDLLAGEDFINDIDPSIDNTLINLSNIFNYEATTFFYGLEERIELEKKLLAKLRVIVPHAWVNFSARAAIGHYHVDSYGTLTNFK
jgi:hypothetical protein